jgi:hypothetical protein
MDSLHVAARFAAFVCYLNRPATPRRAAQLARANWKTFLPLVNENLGKLLNSNPQRRSVPAPFAVRN